MKGVFDTKANSGYDDDVARRYHFPSQYLDVAKTLVGDWIVYREPRRNEGRQAYIAVARVDRIENDPDRYGYYYAIISNYLPFDHAVPLSEDGRYAEEPLRQLSESSRVGAYLQGKSIRSLGALDFNAIVRAGLAETLAPSNAQRLELDPTHADPFTLQLLAEPTEVQERQIEQILLNRPIRDARFRGLVCDAYDNRCAVTRLQMVNGGGNAEVQAAHIVPVSEGGSDVIQNGIALSATVHWLFDRHLISLTDDHRLLVSHNKVPAGLRSLFTHQMERVHLPSDARLHPHPKYLARHRDKFSST
jgi:putative restriction endonuclease